MKSIVWFGVVLALLGIIGLAIPSFTTTQNKEVAKLGEVKVQTTEQIPHTIPQSLSLGAAALGLVLIIAGTLARR